MIGGNIEVLLSLLILTGKMLKGNRRFSGFPSAENLQQPVVPIDFLLEKPPFQSCHSPDQTALNAEEIFQINHDYLIPANTTAKYSAFWPILVVFCGAIYKRQNFG